MDASPLSSIVANATICISSEMLVAAKYSSHWKMNVSTSFRSDFPVNVLGFSTLNLLKLLVEDCAGVDVEAAVDCYD